MIVDVGDRASELCRPVTTAALRTRPAPEVWSALEYLCHLRDVHATATIRLHRMRTEDGPILEPMLNDLRVRRFRYNELDPVAVLDELARTVAGFLDEVERMPADGWHRRSHPAAAGVAHRALVGAPHRARGRAPPGRHPPGARSADQRSAGRR